MQRYHGVLDKSLETIEGVEDGVAIEEAEGGPSWLSEVGARASDCFCWGGICQSVLHLLHPVRQSRLKVADHVEHGLVRITTKHLKLHYRQRRS